MRLRAGIYCKELLFALRGLRRARLFAASSILLLALGIGLASAVFTLLWQAVYAQLPVPAPDRLFTFSTNVTHAGRSDSDAAAQTFSAPAYRYLTAHLRVPAGVIARHGELVNIETPGGPQHALADFVSDNFFDVLGLKPPLGRAFAPADDRQARAVALISYQLWQEAYGGELNVLRRSIRVNGSSFAIAGVTPPAFKGLIAGQAPEVYLLLGAYAGLNPGWPGQDDWSIRWLNAFVRLPASVSSAAAEAELQPVYRASVRQELAAEGTQSRDYLRELAHERVSLVPAAQGAHAVLDEWGEPLRILQWMTLGILALAAINVSGLMLVRGARRQQEMLIRCALGASRRALIRLQTLETLILALAGGALGLLIARWGAQVLAALARLDRGGALSYRPTDWVLAAHWVAAIATGLLVAILPAWQAARLDLSRGLNEGALTHSATRSAGITRQLLAGLQLALSLALVITAGLFGLGLHKLVSVRVGFNPAHLTVFSIDAKSAHSTVAGTELLWTNIARGLEAAPGVQSVTYGTGGPFPQGADAAIVLPEGRAARVKASGMRSIIGPRYFSTLGIRVVAGREFDERDRASAPDTVMLNETLARKLFGNANAIGQTVGLFNGLDPNWLATVVGVVADHHQSWKRANAPLVYTPALQARRVTDLTYYVRGALNGQTIRLIVNTQAPAIAAYDIATMPSRMAEFASGERALTILVSTFALLALAVAVIGIYGVVAYDVAGRTFEFGVRTSFGAAPLDILCLILRQAAAILAAGFAFGIPLTWALVQTARHQLTGLTFRQPAIYAGAFALLSLCTLLAALLPASRAARLNAMDALRHRWLVSTRSHQRSDGSSNLIKDRVKGGTPMNQLPTPRFFTRPANFRKWLEKNHGQARELWVGFYKRASGNPSITWPESVDAALCFGWIDGVRKSLDEASYMIRFTPRKPVSTWSGVNIRRYGELSEAGLVHEAGRRAFEQRSEKRSQIYSYEQREEAKLPPADDKLFRSNRKAWAYFERQPNWYRRTAIYWVVSAKREETRQKRLAQLIADSGQERTIPPLTRPGQNAAAKKA